MKKILLAFTAVLLIALSCIPFVACSEIDGGTEVVIDMMGREVAVTPGSYSKVVCIGAGALRMYSYIGDAENLAGVEDIDNETAEGRPVMFDNVARPYQIAWKETLDTLPSCGKGGPQAQAAEAEKILACNPDIIVSEYEDVDKANALSETVGVPVIVVKYGSAGVFDENVAKSLTLLGKVFGKDEKAATLNSFIASEKAAIEEKVKDVVVAEQKKVYICGLGNWGTTDELQTAQNYAPFNISNINNIVTDLSKDGIQGIEIEKFLDLAPDMDIMIVDAAAVKNIKPKYQADPTMFDTCKAWNDGEVYLQLAYNAYYTNLEIALINTWFNAKVVYPDLFEDINIETKANEILKAFLGKEMYNDVKAKMFSFGGYQKIENPAAFFSS